MSGAIYIQINEVDWLIKYHAVAIEGRGFLFRTSNRNIEVFGLEEEF